MSKPLKIFLSLIVALLLIIILVVVFLNFIYLPRKVASQGAIYLEQKSNGQLQAQNIQYLPFRGVRLENISLLSQTGQPLLTLDKLDFNLNLPALIIRRELLFTVDLYPAKLERVLRIQGVYQGKQQRLDLDLSTTHHLFTQAQTIQGRVTVLIANREKIEIECNLDSADIIVEGKFYLQDKDLHIETLSLDIAGFNFNFIGDVQNLAQPELNIYGELNFNLAGLNKLNPEYWQLPEHLKPQGRCPGKMLVSGAAANPKIDLKLQAEQFNLGPTLVRDFSLVSKLENKRFILSKLYAKLCDGEINFQGSSQLDSPGLPANLNINIFNLCLNKAIKGITGKDTPVQGRVFSLGRLQGALQQPQSVQGKIWLSASGANLLELEALKGVTEVLHLPNLQKIKFREASGNFVIGQQQIRTDDFKIISNVATLFYKGYMDFAGNLGFDIYPSFSRGFLTSTPTVANILGVFTDSAGNFLGEIKMKGNIKEVRYTFKPVSMDKLLPRGLEEGLKQLFKFKKKE